MYGLLVPLKVIYSSKTILARASVEIAAVWFGMLKFMFAANRENCARIWEVERSYIDSDLFLSSLPHA